jgi:hypothetical protein
MERATIIIQNIALEEQDDPGHDYHRRLAPTPRPNESDERTEAHRLTRRRSPTMRFPRRSGQAPGGRTSVVTFSLIVVGSPNRWRVSGERTLISEAGELPGRALVRQPEIYAVAASSEDSDARCRDRTQARKIGGAKK